MSWEPVAAMPPPPPSPSPAERLLYALAESDIPAARRKAGEVYGFHLPSDRWRHLAADLVEACSLVVVGYVGMSLLLEGRPDGALLLILPLQLLAVALRRGAGPRPATAWGGWILAFSLGLPLLVGLGVLPEFARGPLPWLIGLVLAMDAALSARRMEVLPVGRVESAPRGAEPLVIAAVLRDQEGAAPARLGSGVQMHAADLQAWLTAMTQAGVIRMDRAIFGPRVAHLTDEGSRWLETWADPPHRSEDSQELGDRRRGAPSH